MTGQGTAPEVGKDGPHRTSAEDASGSRASQVASLLSCQVNPKDDGMNVPASGLQPRPPI